MSARRQQDRHDESSEEWLGKTASVPSRSGSHNGKKAYVLALPAREGKEEEAEVSPQHIMQRRVRKVFSHLVAAQQEGENAAGRKGGGG
jgi:hypothetical protein